MKVERAPKLVWNVDRQQALLAQVSADEPHSAPHGQAGLRWNDVAAALSTLSVLNGHSVQPEACIKQYNELIAKYKVKMRKARGGAYSSDDERDSGRFPTTAATIHPILEGVLAEIYEKTEEVKKSTDKAREKVKKEKKEVWDRIVDVEAARTFPRNT